MLLKYSRKFSKCTKKARRSNRILFVQILLAFLLITCTVNFYQISYYDITVSKNIPKNSFYVYGKYFKFEDIECLKSKTSGFKDIIGAPFIETKDDKKNLRIFCYEDIFLENYPQKMQNGKWLSKAKKNNGYINVIVLGNNYNYKVGDIVTVNSEKNNYILKIVGICDNESNYMNFSFSKDPAVFGMQDVSRKQQPSLIVAKSDIPENDLIYQYGSYICFNDEVSTGDMRNNYEYLSTLGVAIKYKSTIYNNTINEINRVVNILLPITIILIIFIILGFVCSIMLSSQENDKNIMILKIYGATDKDKLKINCGIMFLLILKSIFYYLLISIIGGFFSNLLKQNLIVFLVNFALIVLLMIFAITLPLI